MRGVIQSVRKSQSGKTLGVQIDNQWYTTKEWGLENMVGSSIVFDPEASDFNGKTMYWINAYTVADEVPQTNGGAQHATQAPTQPTEAPHYNQYQPMVSNLAAHLIAAGRDPKSLQPWFEACLRILEGEVVRNPKAPGQEFDDDIPF